MIKSISFIYILTFYFSGNFYSQKYDVFKLSTVKSVYQMPVIGYIEISDSLLCINLKFFEKKTISIKKINEYTHNTFKFPTYVLEMTSTDDRYRTDINGTCIKLGNSGLLKKKSMWTLQMSYYDKNNALNIDLYTILPAKRK